MVHQYWYCSYIYINTLSCILDEFQVIANIICSRRFQNLQYTFVVAEDLHNLTTSACDMTVRYLFFKRVLNYQDSVVTWCRLPFFLSGILYQPPVAILKSIAN